MATKSAAAKLAAISQVLNEEPKDINYPVDFTLTAYNLGGKDLYEWDVGENVIDVRLLPDTTQASTVEIDLDDSDYVLLQHPIFAHWAFNIQDVSLDSAKKFKTSRLTNSTNNEYLGDNSDLEWVLGQRPIDFTIGFVTFRLCGLATQDTTLTLTFEDRVASWLRDQEGFKTVNRGTYTRAGFVALLCREAGVDYWIPEIDVAQPVETSTSSLSPSQQRLVTGKGLGVGQGLTLGGFPVTQTMIDNMNIALDVGTQLGANNIALQAIIYAGWGESAMGTDKNTYDPTTGANGVWQAEPGDYNNGHDTVAMAKAWFQGGKDFQAGGGLKASQVYNVWQTANAVEANAVWNRSGQDSYAAQFGSTAAGLAEVAKIVQAYGGPNSSKRDGRQTTQTAHYAFTRGPNEDSYDCIMRLASEVAWYAFVRQNRLWFVSGNYLFQQQPQMTIERGKNGVDTIDPNLDMGARDSLAQCTVNARTDLWAALPGMVVQVNKRGPATGKWFVASFESHPLDESQQVTITLQKPVPKRSEPAAEDIANQATNNKTKLTLGNTSPGTAEAAYAAAQYLSGLQVPYYKYDRDVTRALTKGMPVDKGLDCSASVGWVLNAAGFQLPGLASAAPASGSYLDWGEAGPGKQMTIWTAADHIFIEFHLQGRPHQQGNTVNPAGGGAGFRLFNWTSIGIYAGPAAVASGHFTARHWPNT